MGDIKTPRNAKGANALRLITKTTSSVSTSRIPARSARNFRHAHSLTGAREIARIDRRPWEARVAKILRIVESHRYDRNNAIYNAINAAEKAMLEARRKKEEVETFAEELRAANEEMRASNEEMRAANEELRSLSEMLDRMQDDIEQFVSRAGDMLLEPLGSIGSLADDLLEGYGERLEPRDRDRLSKLRGEAARMGEALDGLVRYWLVDTEAESPKPIHCETALERAVSTLQEVIEESGASLTNDPLPIVTADETQLAALFEKLVDNAVRFRGEEPPRIHISAEDIASTEIELPDPRIDDGWVFSVSDNGTGIEDRDQNRVFMIFERIEEDEARSGMGMGLAIAWKIVKHLGGDIWVESRPEKGSVFRFTIPRKDFDAV